MSDFDQLKRDIAHYFDDTIYTVVGVEAVKFFRLNFKKQGFVDHGLQKWKAVKASTLKQKRNKNTMLHESGNLKKSIRWKRGAGKTVIIYNDEPYAEIHNEGGKITGVFNVSEHTRRTKYGKVNVRAHTRKVDTEIPQRQFMGDSKELIEHLQKMIYKDLRAIIKKYA